MTNNAQAELVGRLLAMYSHRGDGIPTQYVNPDGPEAAAEIERMAGEVERLRYILEGLAENPSRCEKLMTQPPKCARAYAARKALGGGG